MKAWEKGGRSGARPRPRILPRPADLHIISWWAAAIQLPGILVRHRRLACTRGLGRGSGAKQPPPVPRAAPSTPAAPVVLCPRLCSRRQPPAPSPAAPQLFDVGCVIDVVSMAVEISKPLATWGIAFTFTCGGALFTGTGGGRAGGAGRQAAGRAGSRVCAVTGLLTMPWRAGAAAVWGIALLITRGASLRCASCMDEGGRCTESSLAFHNAQWLARCRAWRRRGAGGGGWCRRGGRTCTGDGWRGCLSF